MSGRSLVPKMRFDKAPGDCAELLARCEETIRRLRFDATALPISGLTFGACSEGVRLVVEIRAPDRNKLDELEWVLVWRTLICPWGPLESNGPEYLVRWLRETIANTLAHEVDEALTYDGVRVFDPHRPLTSLGFDKP